MLAKEYITLAHGNGGRFMRELIANIFACHLNNADLDTSNDASPISLPDGQVMFTTDGFTVNPLEFPGGNIGSLAIHGTCNDLAVSGADPLYLTLNAFIEEGLAIEQLDRLVHSSAAAANAIGVHVVAGDTKVLPRGECSGLYLATSGIGIRQPSVNLDIKHIQVGDHILISGPIGDHGVCVMLAREDFGMRGNLQSDAASVLRLAQQIRDLPGVRFMRDPTRGGLATVCHEISQATQQRIVLDSQQIPIQPEVESVCEILGYDPLYLACEGRIVTFVAADSADEVLATWQTLPEGAQAADIGVVEAGSGRVEIITELGGRRILEELQDDPLPRIC
jgi:hydrogenase expression/formation protein HypE